MKNSKKLLAVILSIVLVISCFGVTGVFASTENLTIIEPTDLTDGKTSSGIAWNVKLDYLNADSNYNGTTLQVDNIDEDVLAQFKNNVVAKVEFADRDDSTEDEIFDLGKVTDGRMYNYNYNPTDSWDHAYYTREAVDISVGTELFENDEYDATVTLTLKGETQIDALYSFASPNPNLAWSTYKIYVGNDLDTLYDDANEVAYFDYYQGYQTTDKKYCLNAAKSAGKCSEGQIWRFEGDEKPSGSYVGYKIYYGGYYAHATNGNRLDMYEIGAFGSLTVIEPTDLTNGNTSSGTAWTDKLNYLNADSNYKGTTLQVDNIDEDVLAQFEDNLVTKVELADTDDSTENEVFDLEKVTDGSFYNYGTNGTYDLAYYTREAVDILAGTELFETDKYDATITLTLKGETKIDALYSFTHPNPNLAWSTYKIYVSNDLDTLYDDANEVAYFDYYQGYQTKNANYCLNAKKPAKDNKKCSEGQIWRFEGEKPFGTYVGYKIYYGGYYADGSGRNRLDMYEIGVFGSYYNQIEIIHNDLVEVVPHNCTFSLIPGEQMEFKVNVYDDTEVTAVKIIKDGAEDIILTANDGIYTTPALEEGMKIKIETNADDTAPINGVWKGIDLTKNSTAYDPQIWGSDVTYNEAVMFHEGRTTVELLYPIKQVVSVRSYDLQTVYYPNKDYVVTADGKLQIPEGSAIAVNEETNHTMTGSTGSNDWEPKQWKYQVMVTYTHDTTWGNNALYETKPESQLNSLASFHKKASSKETTNVVFIGDSVGLGHSATGFNEQSRRYNSGNDYGTLTKFTATEAPSYGLDVNNLPDWVCDTWPRAVEKSLKAKYGDNITYTNRAIGSSASAWGVEDANIRAMFDSAECPVPDLLFIHYGLNEAKADKEDHKSRIQAFIDYVRTELNPDCAVVLVSSFQPNWHTDEGELTAYNVPQFEEAYYEIAEANENVAVVPVYSITKSIISVKSPLDYTHNHFNHPNDFGARVYAASVLSVLDAPFTTDYPAVKTTVDSDYDTVLEGENLLVDGLMYDEESDNPEYTGYFDGEKLNKITNTNSSLGLETDGKATTQANLVVSENLTNDASTPKKKYLQLTYDAGVSLIPEKIQFFTGNGSTYISPRYEIFISDSLDTLYDPSNSVYYQTSGERKVNYTVTTDKTVRYLGVRVYENLYRGEDASPRTLIKEVVLQGKVSDGDFLYSDKAKENAIEYKGSGGAVSIPASVTTVKEGLFNIVNITKLTVNNDELDITGLMDDFSGVTISANKASEARQFAKANSLWFEYINASDAIKYDYNDDSSVNVCDFVILAKHSKNNEVVILKQAGDTDSSAVETLRKQLLSIDSEVPVLSDSASVSGFASTVADDDGDLI